MLTLLLRTDKPEAELFLYKDSTIVSELTWEAHRQLAETLHTKIGELLKISGHALKDLKKIGIYEGPGSFTGLRIGMSVANALGHSFEIPVVQAGGEKWISECLSKDSDSFTPVSPVYGGSPHITKQKK